MALTDAQQQAVDQWNELDDAISTLFDALYIQIRSTLHPQQLSLLDEHICLDLDRFGMLSGRIEQQLWRQGESEVVRDAVY